MADLLSFFRRYWIKQYVEDTQMSYNLPLTDVVLLNYYSGKETRIYTVEIYTIEDDIWTKVAEDDGVGNIVEVVSGCLNTATGIENSVNYEYNEITIHWDPTFLSGLTAVPVLKWKYKSATKENHAEMLDLLNEIFSKYKEDELEDRSTYYQPDDSPIDTITQLATDHNYVIDKLFSTEDSYFRQQLKELYRLYKSKRKIDGVKYALATVGKRVNLYNLLAKKGEYDDYSSYIPMDTDTLLQIFDAASEYDKESLGAQIENIYNAIYADSSDYYPTKHFLLDIALDALNYDGYLIGDKDTITIKNYILKIKASTQFPHLQTYLGILDTSSTDGYPSQQDTSGMLYKISEAEQLLAISDYRTYYTGPSQVYSSSQTNYGAWLFFPLEMNTGHEMNTALYMNMWIDDLQYYFSKFKIGKDSWSTVTNTLTDIKDSFFESRNIVIYWDELYAYVNLIIETDEGNDYPIKEVGIFNANDTISFYAKHPSIYKNSSHKHEYRIKLKVSIYDWYSLVLEDGTYLVDFSGDELEVIS